MKSKLLILLFVALSFNAIGQKSGYTLIWQDEFDELKMDSSKFRHRLPGAKRVDGYNSVKNAFVNNGNMLILATYDVDSNKYYGGMVGTEETFQTTYGYFEASIKLQKKLGHWPAFWLQSPDIQANCVNNPATYGVEVDIIEYLRKNPTQARHTLHWDGYSTCHKSQESAVSAPSIASGYHKFAVEWTANEYIFYIDDVETKRTSVAVSQRSEYIILSMEHGSWGGAVSPENNPDTAFVDYVRVYKKNVTGSDNVLETNKDVSLFPNPANGFIQIKNLPSENCTVALYDISGKLVLSKSLSDVNATIDITTLSSGAYIIEVASNSNVVKKQKLMIK